MNLPFIATVGRFACFITCIYCLVAIYNCDGNVETVFIIGYLLLAALMFVEPLEEIEVMTYFLFFFAGGIAFIFGAGFNNFGAGMFGVS